MDTNIYIHIYIYNPSQRHNLNCNLELQCLDMINMCSQSLPAFHQCFEAILREVNPFCMPDANCIAGIAKAARCRDLV